MIGQPSLSVQSPVQDDGDIAVQMDRFIHGYGESDVMFVLGVLLTKDENIVEEDNLSVHISYRDDECFPVTVNPLVPPESEMGGQHCLRVQPPV
jgi:hypothetical protein